MAKEICISTTPHETRLAILEDDQLAEVYYERENEYTLAGSVYKGRVTRVLPGMQSSFVDVGLERDAFLYVTDFLEDSEDADEYETSSAGGRRPAAIAVPVEEEAIPEEKRGRRDGRRGEGKGRERSTELPARVQAAEERAVVATALRTAEPTEEQSAEKGDEEEAPQGTRRWRGRRGRRRGGVRAGGLGTASPEATVEEAEEQLSQPATAPFDLPEHGAPGGLAAPFVIDQIEDEVTGRVSLRASAARPEPASAHSASTKGAITLPGESLSKYGGVPVASNKAEAKLGASARSVNYTPPRPATLVEVNAAGWDGGSVMPGETLSRYRKVLPEIAEAQAASTLDLATEFGAERGLNAPIEPEPSAQDLEMYIPDAVSPETVAEALPGTEHAERLVTSAEPLHSAEQSMHAMEETDPPMEGGFAELQTSERQEEHAPEQEYEPREGESASQAAPPNRSELRLSQLFGMGEKTPASEPESQRATVEAGMEGSEGQEPNAVVHVQEAELWKPELPQSDSKARHGEIAAVEEGFEAETEIMQDPLAHSLEAAGAPAAADTFTDLVDQLHGFAPGSGLLEEEVIDEEEYDFDPVHAHADEHDLEDLEEETLDGAEEGGTALVEPDRKADRSSRPLETAEVDEDEEDERGAFALEEIGEEEEEGAPAALAVEGEPRRRERGAEDASRRGSRNGGRRRGIGGGGRRQSAQTQDLPIISDLLKQGQEILVQIAKEPIAKKGARITSHIALPGRFLVFMPTVNHVGVSRKIASDEERQRLKRILIHEKGESSGGFIVRTAAEGASEEELRADLRFLINLWTEIKQRADTAKAPALIYHDLNLVERILRDQVSSNFSTIWVDTEQEYERIVRFLNRFQPSLVRRVKLYTKETPLFEHFGIQEEITKALKSKVWLKSGGSIVINQTEALVAIDINTGKYVGKTARLEDTIVKTNLDAIPEIVRQIRLRDLGGIIVIDFIDMDERKNRNRVLAALEEAMKVDRAPSKVLQFNDFGLVAITRKRVKQSLERTLSVQCEICSGTGMVKSPITVCNEIYIELRKMQRHLDGKDVMLRVHPEVVKQLKGGTGRWIGEYEEIVGKTIIIKSDPSLHPEQFDIQ